MCGITGCLALADGAGPDTEWVGRAAMRIAHRGPDDEGFFADRDLALGFRRLAIIDTSVAGRQPMQSADGRFVMVFDGEIYNYVELAQRLGARGVRLRSRSCSRCTPGWVAMSSASSEACMRSPSGTVAPVSYFVHATRSV
jgi:asparagine synthase (glutamine-hydrolysing)